jgi:hypothetical protein
MHGRWFNSGVVLLWLATMTWLVKEKVLPPLLTGEPPNYSKIIEAQENAPTVGWQILCNDQRVGWALSDASLQPNELTDIHGRIHVRSLPLTATMSSGLRAFLQLFAGRIDDLRMDAWSVLTIDQLGRLAQFESAVRVEPFQETISVTGTVDNGDQLQLQFHAGGASFHTEAYLPSHALLSDALSPQTQLPGLRTGQSWTVPVYSPLLPAKNPLEIIYAEVEGMEPIVWDDATQDTWLVVYRSEPKSVIGTNQAPRGKLWVRRDGTVLQQQVLFFDITITFVRLPDDEAAGLAERTGPKWWSREDDPGSPKHD